MYVIQQCVHVCAHAHVCVKIEYIFFNKQTYNIT